MSKKRKKRDEGPGFKPVQHFASGRVAVCFKCERIAESAWPAGWPMMYDGIMCPWCAFGDRVDADGNWIAAE